jgi:GNAT superfamily N-acetyltransferase
LCDDDLFDFRDCSDVTEAIESEKPDLISIGSPGDENWPRGIWLTAREAASPGRNYLGVFTFASGVIFRTALFGSDEMVKGFRAAATAYPHFPFIARTIYDNRLIYVSRQKLVLWDPRPNFDSQLHFWKLYVAACQTIEDARLREQVIDEMFPSRLSWIRALGRAVFDEKIHRRKGIGRALFEIAQGFTMKQRLFLAATAPLLVLPAAVCRGIERVRKGGPATSSSETAVESFRLS